MKKIVLLGATGSIGENTLKVVDAHREALAIVGIAAKSRWERLATIAKKYQVKHVGIFDGNAARAAAESGLFAAGTRFYVGAEGLEALAALADADLVLTAVVGTLGLKPTLAAIEAGKDVAVASKEILVLAGKFVMAAAARKGVKILPVDSEHNAIFQCIGNEPSRAVDRIILTASGGVFRDWTLEAMTKIVPADALKNPNWDMGPKVTVDSSSMANKGLELIEATWLFGVPAERVDIVVHPQSVVHSMVKFLDGSVLAQLAPPSMTFPIQNCLFYPERVPATVPGLDFAGTLSLDFRQPDYQKYKCLRLARECAAARGVAPAIFNAANEVAVEAFLNRGLPYLQIPELIEKVLGQFENFEPVTLEEVLALDAQARERAAALL
ncbi:MAG: 1-deoxy-D-xylulose-5-phosphate reductoisomerase [Opitutales bacterium]|nr:1-deoxy-D-xylulose-5-phosphate reductoisomerase [Opitutales bacterium]